MSLQKQNNIFRLIGIMYISIGLKNILQILFATIFTITEPKAIINLRKILSLEQLCLSLKVVFIYDFILLAFTLYLIAYFLLYLFAQLLGNKFLLHIIYMISMYVVMLFVNRIDLNIFFLIIVFILGSANWWMFKKWLKFEK